MKSVTYLDEMIENFFRNLCPADCFVSSCALFFWNGREEVYYYYKKNN
jgi:hypothetical protein